VVCGSAASYMIKNIIKNKGGLHNRLTQTIRLMPFNLNETELLLKQNKVKLSRYDIVQLYMATGGVPHYLQKIKPGESVAQALDRLCFGKDGFLRTEFDNVFASLFDQYENHEEIIRVLATVRKGLTRNEILSKIKIDTGGTLTKTLTDLEESGFIEKYMAYRGTKDALFRLTDEYSMFYIKFIEHTKPAARGLWMKVQRRQPYKIWSGFSFETICIKHVEQIKEALKIGGIHSTHGSWIQKKAKQGAQIDLLIDRDDNVINLCEMKFYAVPFTMDKKCASDIAKKTDAFCESTKTKKSIYTTFITAYGVTPNGYSRQHIQNELTMDDLFAKL
jgi:DNA-binding MarR family transcriptional regulator